MFLKKILSCISMMLVLFMLVTAPVHTKHTHNDSDSVTVVSADYQHHEQKDNNDTENCSIHIHQSFYLKNQDKFSFYINKSNEYLLHHHHILSYSLVYPPYIPPQYILS